MEFSYRFTGAESKKLSWYFSSVIQELLKIPTLTNGSLVKLYGLLLIAINLRDAIAVYSRVEVSQSQVENLKEICKHYFTAVKLIIGKVNPTVWTMGYAVPYHTQQLFDELGYGLGLNSMEGREAKHIKLARYVENTCNVRKDLRWAIVFRHEFVALIWLREMDPYHATHHRTKDGVVSFIPKKVANGDSHTCHCGLWKTEDDERCNICTSDTMKLI